MNKNLSIAEEVQTRLERKNQIAIRHGLPSIGARMVNKHGIEWVVDGHLFAPDLASHVRDGGALKEEDPRDLFPAVIPLNLSPRLRDFYMETDRCTSKHLMMLDTVPSLRPQQAKANVHYISFNRDPARYLFYLDIANLHETILAHEIAHLWVDLTEGIEDYYVMCDVSDPGKVYQFEYVNSFVIDFWINDIIRERGFDMSVIDGQERQAVLLYAQAVAKGYWPVKKREAAFMALPIAAILLQQEKGSGNNDKDLSEATTVLKKDLADVYRLAQRLAAVIKTYGYADHKSSELARAECLQLSYEFTDDQFIPDVELTHKKVIQPDYDKTPNFFPGLSVPAKLEIGRALAKHKISGFVQMCFSLNPSGQVEIKFIDAAGNWTPPTVLQHTTCIPDCGLPVPFAHKPPTPYELRPPAMKPRALVPQPFQRPRVSSSVPLVQSLSAPIPPSWSGQAAPDFVNRNYLPGLALSLAQTRSGQMENTDPNLYRYVENNPVNYVDPSGLKKLGGLLQGQLRFNGCTANFVNAYFCVLPEEGGNPIINPGNATQNIDGIAFGNGAILKVPDNCTLIISCSAGQITNLSCDCITLGLKQRCAWVNPNKDAYFKPLRKKCIKPFPPINRCVKSFLGRTLPTVPGPR